MRAAPVGQEHKDILAENLRQPTAMTFGPDGNLYVSVFGHQSNRGEGQVLRLRLTPAPARPASRFIPFVVPWATGLAVLLLMLGIGYKFRQRRPD